MSFTAACIQLTSGPDIESNIEAAEVLIREAAGKGATLIVTPEVTDLICQGREDRLAKARTQDEHPGISRFSALAKELGIWLIAGSFLIKIDEERLANRCFVFNPQGAIAAQYDKIHMFYVDLPSGEQRHESALVRPGDRAVCCDTSFARLGLSICYDVRFPELYGELAKAGAGVITIPAAFTVPTGQAHWHVLVRARAIEAGAYILAPAQCGSHDNDRRRTYGHSLIVTPWGEILAEAGETPGVITAEIDMNRVEAAHAAVPRLHQLRNFQPPEITNEERAV
jgi:predicted amidohydrolase